MLGSPPADLVRDIAGKDTRNSVNKSDLGRLERSQDEAPVRNDRDASDSRRAQNQDLIAEQDDEVDRLHPHADPKHRADTPPIESRPDYSRRRQCDDEGGSDDGAGDGCGGEPPQAPPDRYGPDGPGVIDHHLCGLGGRDSLVEELALEDDETGTSKSDDGSTHNHHCRELSYESEGSRRQNDDSDQDAAENELESDICPKVCVLRRNWTPNERSCHSDTATEHQKERRDRQCDRVQSELVGREQPSDDDRRRQAQDLRQGSLRRQQGSTRRGPPTDVTCAQWRVRYVYPTALPCEFRLGSLHRTIFQALENRVPERLVLNLATWLEPLRRRLRARVSAVSATLDVQAHRGSRPTPRGAPVLLVIAKAVL